MENKNVQDEIQTENTEVTETEFELEQENPTEEQPEVTENEETEEVEEPEVTEVEEPATYTLEEYQALESRNAELESTIETLNAQIAELTAFQVSVERERKQAMIDSFSMLEDADKLDVQENIDNYSLDDIEAKLSIICVKKKVKFDSEQPSENHNELEQQLSYSMNNSNVQAESDVPAWIKSVREHKN